jgi:hypothetical protein
MGSGYVYRTPCDIEVSEVNGKVKITVLNPQNQDFVGARPAMPQFVPPQGYHEDHFAWWADWAVELPEGYSALYSQPFNRFELPFLTTSGIIDNDKVHLPGTMPFFIVKGFTGVIPAGTPYAQIMPFKRENWIAEIETEISYEDMVQKNAAKYGLQTFANVNDEPWHVQPAELPRGRSEYEKKNSPWGTIAGGSQYDPESKFNGSPDIQGHRSSSATGVAKQSVESYGQMSIAESIAASRQANQDLLGAQGGGMGRTKSVSSVAMSSNTKAADSAYSSQSVPSSWLVTRNNKTWGSYQIPKRRFTRADWDAIAQVETKKNWKFVNGSKVFRGGLAMHNKVWDFFGGREFARWAERATPEEQNKIAERSSFDGYNDPKTGKFKPAVGIGGFESVAKNAIKWPNIKTGDGAPTSTPVRSGGSVRIEGGSNITIAPTIYIQSAGNNSADAQRAAKEVSNMMVKEIKIAAMRSM